MSKFNLEQWQDHVPGLMGARSSYAVLVPFLCEEGKEPTILFETRARTLRHQPGEVCFPGGRREGDETYVQCALRETEEELGIPSTAIEVVGQADFLLHSRGFLVYPILGKVTGRGIHWDHVNADEVAEVFEVPVSFFEENEPQVWTYPLVPQFPDDFPYELLEVPRGQPWKERSMDVPVYLYEGHVIWGLTARILRHLFAK